LRKKHRKEEKTIEKGKEKIAGGVVGPLCMTSYPSRVHSPGHGALRSYTPLSSRVYLKTNVVDVGPPGYELSRPAAENRRPLIP